MKNNIFLKFKKAIYYLIEGFIRPIDGSLGELIRYYWYKNKFISCGINVKIGINVKFSGCENIEIGDHVWIDDNTILIAGMPKDFGSREVKIRKTSTKNLPHGKLKIGSQIHFAPNCIINAFGGGIEIDDYCGFSSGVKIYSMSNHYRSYKNPNLITYSNPMSKKLPIVLSINPIIIEKNCFISLNSIILGGHISTNSFVTPNSVLIGGKFKSNSIISGQPAKASGERFKKDE